MKPFSYQTLASVDELSNDMPAGVQFYAGGTDLLTRMKAGLAKPEQLLDIKRSGLPRAIELQGQTMRLGALTTLTDIERYDFLPEHVLLADAARQAATPQLRNRATLGGTLCQRPRCWYYRNSSVDCWLKGGTDCRAREGRNEHHALFGANQCVAVHPSDIASCLMVLDASVELVNPASHRTLSVAELFALPGPDRRRETTIDGDELIVAVSIPIAGPGHDGVADSAYLKVMDRKAWAFALVGLAASWRLEGGVLTRLNLALSGVAAIPWRLPAAEESLRGKPPTAAAFAAAADDAVQEARPLSDNQYKVELVRRLLQSMGERLRADSA